MKSLMLAITLCLYVSFGHAQDKGRSILEKAQKACEAVENGRYTLQHEMKFFTGTDTSLRIYDVSFIKDTTLEYGAVVRMYSGDTIEAYYDGAQTTVLLHYKKSGFKTSNSPGGTYFGRANYQPFLEAYPLKKILDEGSIKYITDTMIQGNMCYKIEVGIKGSEDNSEVHNFHFFYYIDKNSYLPLKRLWTVDLMEMRQYKNEELLSYEINTKGIEAELIDFKVPEDYSIDDLDTIKRPELLDSATAAPLWTLPLQGGDSMSLADIKGKVVLIDFFYRSCYPCMKALPGIQMLHEHFKGKDVVVMAIDPYDKDDEMLQEFLKNRNITYPVALEATEVAAAYHVKAYPTFYVIDKNGRVHKTYIGYSEGRENEIMEMVERMLAGN